MTLKEAIFQNDLNQVEKILIQDPPCIDETDERGIPYWMHAARLGCYEIVRYVVEYSRASMNTTDLNGRGILHYAAMSGNVELNRYLVEKVGMEITAGDRNLVTPYQLAFEGGHEQLLLYYQEKTGAAYEEMYHNPIRTGMFPDPSIIRVGDDYYMVNSSFIFFPCIPISHSRDLIHWEIVGHAITNPAWAKLDELEGGRGYWAPDISYYDGVYYITATYRLNDTGCVYRRQIVVSSDKPEGPYSEPSYIEEDGIDPSIFHDEDGRHYMLLNRGARILELSSDCKKQIGKAQLLYYGSQKRAPEGPHLIKKDGYYYLFLAEGGTGPGHRITVSRSRELLGNYEPCPFNPIMRQMDEKAAIQRCGHGKPVCTQNGEWYMVYLCGRRVEYQGENYSILGRETALDPITWTSDGWPMVNDLKGPSVLQVRPDLPEWNPKEGTYGNDFMCPRAPEEDGVRILKDGIILKGSRAPLESVDARNILLRRQTHFCFEAECVLRIPKLAVGQEAGMTCYYDENTWISFFVGRDENYYLQVREHVGITDQYHEKIVLTKTGTIPGRRLKLKVETNHLKRRFSYFEDLEAIEETKEESKKESKESSNEEFAGESSEGLKVESKEEPKRESSEELKGESRLKGENSEELKGESRLKGENSEEFKEESGVGLKTKNKEEKTAAELDSVYYLCDEGIRMGKRFTGAMVGMYAYAGKEPLFAEFENFVYRNL